MRIKSTIFLLLILLTGFEVKSQSLEWIFNTNTNPNDSITDLFVDGIGNSYITGTFNGTMDFDPGTGVTNLTASGIETFIAKYDNAKNLIWVKQISNNSNSLKVNRSSIELNSAGEILVTGSFSEDTDFDPGSGTYILSSMMDYDQYLLKLDNNGNFLWATSFSNFYGFGYEFASSIEIDENNDIYISGLWKDASSMVPDINYLLKYSINGNLLWNKTFSQNLNLINGDGIVSFENSLILFGSFNGTMDINPDAPIQNLTSAGNSDGIYIEIDTSGFFYGGGKIGGSSFDAIFDIAFDNLNNLYFTGFFNGNADLNPGAGISNLTSNGSTDIFIVKIDASRNFVYNKQIGGISEDYGYSISYKSGQLFLCGTFEGSVDFDPGTNTINMVSQNTTDAFLLTLDTFAQFSDIRTFDGNAIVSQIKLETDGNNNIYISGSFFGSGDFDPSVAINSITPMGLFDSFLMKLRPCTTTYSTLNIDDCGSYTINSQTYNLSGTYTQLLINQNGCDSILTLNLNLNQVIQEVCVVTVDTILADHNIIVWEKPSTIDFIDSFIIYRETVTGSGSFNYLISIHRDSLSEYADLTANPNISEYTYHIKILDTCGTIIGPGLFHRSIFLNYTGLGNFTWTDYEIENQTNVVSRYNFWRDSVASGDWRILDTIPATGTNNYTDNDYALYPNALYRVDLVFSSGNSCSPSRVGVNTSRSNIKNQSMNGNSIFETTNITHSIYPNPAGHQINVQLNVSTNANAELFDVTGKVVYSGVLNSNINTISTEVFANGIYTLRLQDEKNVQSVQIVIAK